VRGSKNLRPDHIEENRKMRRATTAILGLMAVTGLTAVHADVTVLAVRLGASDVVELAKFYDAAFGLKENRPRWGAGDGDHHALR
jgi:cell division protein FtsB